jgi:tetratricopeptide (TPR) repeat protein
MKTAYSMCVLSCGFFLFGCTAMRLAGDVNSGRQALIIGKNEEAATYFRSAAEKDPNYLYGTPLRQGIWSYVGRTDYALGRLPQAREALERALGANREEDIARLYLGLTLARQGDRQRGLQEIEGGLTGIHGWLEYITQAFRFSFGQFWDPSREIRAAIESDLAMISGKDIEWQQLIGSGEWIGKRIEEESDLARRQESREWSRESDGDSDEP